ncbi:MAG: putative zinc-binding protein [Actinobacteria bacterium]|nr:putative zinc-binding protein [Actinomycetota bacterium]MCL6086955.1 putative zinc-binding protein [Actinomycetota bacterium]
MDNKITEKTESENKNKKVGIVSCSGEDLPEGSVCRLATLEVLLKRKPFDTTTICLPLYIAGGEGDRMFAKNYPTITVDGCEKLCAKKATEKFSGKVTHSINVRDFLKEGEEPVNRRNLNDMEKEIAGRVADEIEKNVDRILNKGQD